MLTMKRMASTVKEGLSKIENAARKEARQEVYTKLMTALDHHGQGRISRDDLIALIKWATSDK